MTDQPIAQPGDSDYWYQQWITGMVMLLERHRMWQDERDLRREAEGKSGRYGKMWRDERDLRWEVQDRVKELEADCARLKEHASKAERVLAASERDVDEWRRVRRDRPGLR